MKLTNALSDAQKTQLEFWQRFVNMPRKTEYSNCSTSETLAQNWYDLAAGSSEYHINLLATCKNKLGLR